MLCVLARLIWTRTHLGTLGVASPGVNLNLGLVHYKRNVMALTSASILESETLIESPPSFLASVLVF